MPVRGRRFNRAARAAALCVSLALASCASQSGPSPEVLAIMQSAQARVQSADAYSNFLIARFASLTNDPEVAASAYARAAHRAPEDGGLVERAVFSSLLAGDVDDALSIVKRASPEALQGASLSRLLLGVDLLSEGDAARARAVLDRGDFGSFNGIIARGVAAWAALDADGLEAAEDVLIAGRSGDALMDGLTSHTAAMLQLAAGEDEAALATFESGWGAGLRLAMGAEAYARLLAANGRRADAIARLAEFRASVGRHPSVEALRRDLEAGLEVDIRRPSIREGAARAIYAPAAALAAQTDGDLAGVYFALALSLDPNLDAARTLWGDALDMAGRTRAAAAVLGAVSADSPYYATARGQLAWVLRREDRNDEALSTAAEALAARPDRDLKVQLGDLYRSLSRDEEADRLFSEIIEADAARGEVDWRILFARGAARHRLGFWSLAERDLVAAADLAPDEADVLNYLGYAWVDRGENIDEAFQLIKRAVELRPDAGYIVDSLGWAYYRLGMYDEAVRQLERAAELSPSDPEINDHLGDAYWRVGRRLEAGYQWRRALSLSPDASLLAELERKLSVGLVDGSHQELAQDSVAPIQ
ncbi:MAG: tetratricopeptide repeat protein [Pseudomonadota bacterium]